MNFTSRLQQQAHSRALGVGLILFILAYFTATVFFIIFA